MIKNLLQKLTHEVEAPEGLEYQNYDMVELKLKDYKWLRKVDHFFSHEEVEMICHIVLKPNIERYVRSKDIAERNYQKKIKEGPFTEEVEQEYQKELKELGQRLEKYNQENPVVFSVGTVQEMKDISKGVRFNLVVPDEFAMEINKMKSRVENYLLALEMWSDYTKRVK